MKAVLISIHPMWCELIGDGKKTIEVRKSRPRIETPFKCYIYCTKPKSKKDWSLCYDNDYDYPWQLTASLAYCENHNIPILSGKVIGEFICNKISEFFPERYPFNEDGTCLTPLQIMDYANGKKAYAWHISNLVIYDEPKELNEFSKECPSDNCLECPHSISSDPRYFYEETKIVGCRNNVKRPPQSWCYVEELESE